MNHYPFQLLSDRPIWVAEGRRPITRVALAGGGWSRKRKRSPTVGYPKRCEICDITVNGQYELNSHKNGNRHMKNVRKKELAEKLEKKRNAQQGPNPDEKFLTLNPASMKRMCTLCNVEFSSSVIEESHIRGRRHVQNVRNSQRGGRILKSKRKLLVNIGSCEVCNCKYTSEVMKKTHRAGKKHIKNCRIRGVNPSSPQRSPKPITKKPKLDLSRWAPAPIWGELIPYKILERQAENAYENYKTVAKVNPTQGEALYMRYLTLYKAYELAFQEHADKVSGLELKGYTTGEISPDIS